MNPDKLFNYLEGKLSPTERDELEDQLIRDPELQRQFAMARKIHERMSGEEREVVLDEPPAAVRSRQLMRRIMLVFLTLIFLNIVVGVVVIGVLENRRQKARVAAERSRQDLAAALQRAAANALPTPSLDIGEITIAAPAREQETVIERIIAAAKRFGGSAARNISNDSGTLMFAEIPADHLPQFRNALIDLGATMPASPAPAATSGNVILQLRIIPRPE